MGLPVGYIVGMTSIDPRTIALGQEIRAEAAALGITLKALAEAVHIDRTSLYYYLDGKRAMPLPVLRDIATVLRVPAGELLDRGEDRARKNTRTV